MIFPKLVEVKVVRLSYTMVVLWASKWAELKVSKLAAWWNAQWMDLTIAVMFEQWRVELKETSLTEWSKNRWDDLMVV